MAEQTDKKQPAQVPGDAEAPPQGEPHPAVKEGVRQPDKTEPVPSAESPKKR